VVPCPASVGNSASVHVVHPHYNYKSISAPFMPIQDRTNEFKACVESIRNRSSLPPRASDAKQRFLQTTKVGGKSEFSRMASAIGKDISSTTVKLGKLAQCESLCIVSKKKTHVPKWPSGKLSLTIGQSKLVYLHTIIQHQSSIDLSSGTHIYNQTRHCQHQQADSSPSVIRQATKHTGIIQFPRRKTN